MRHACSRIGDGEMHRAVRAACLMSALLATPALAQEVKLLDKFKDWSAYAASGPAKVCFAVYLATLTSPQLLGTRNFQRSLFL